MLRAIKVSFIIHNKPFQPQVSSVNELTFGKFLRMGAACQGNHVIRGLEHIASLPISEEARGARG